MVSQAYQATHRLMQLTSSAFADDTFLIAQCNAVERLSDLFDFNLSAFTTNRQLDAKSLAGKSVNFQIKKGSAQRQFNARIAHAKRIGRAANGTIHYELRLVPWLWFLHFSSDVRRYENQNAVDIVTSLCKQCGFHDIDTSQLTKHYPVLPYSVQYNESAIQFIHRILQSQGIYYYFSHTRNKHTLVLIDQFNQFMTPKTIHYSQQNNMNSHIFQWQRKQQWVTQGVASVDYHIDAATSDLHLQYPVEQAPKIGQSVSSTYFSVPGNYHESEQGKTRLRHIAAQHAANLELVVGQSNVIGCQAGLRFMLDQHRQSKQNKSYLLLSVTHIAIDNSYIPDNHESTQAYHNQFEAIMAVNAHVAPTILQIDTQPVSAQTACVDGETQNQLTSDTLGRLKTRYYWQHNDDNQLTGHWMSKVHLIAGNGWGSQFLPTVGDEAHVRYLYGDPTRPIMVSGLHNAAKLPYHQLPNQQSQWGITTKTHHQLNFDDTKNKEQLTVTSSKKMVVTSKNDATRTVEKNLTTTTHNTHTEQSQTHSIHTKQQFVMTGMGGIVMITPDKISLKGNQVNLNNTSSGSSFGKLGDIALLVGGLFLDEVGVGEAMQGEAVADLEGETVLKELPHNPDDLVEKHGYEETSHPEAKAEGHRAFKHPKNGDILEHDAPKEGESGFRGKNHYHRLNPKRTGRRDWYLDKNGEPVSKSSKASHLLPGGE